MLNQNMSERGAQATGLGVMIGRCFSYNQHGSYDHHPANVGCSLFRYTNSELRNHTNQRCKHKNGLGKTTNLHYNAIFGATLHKEDIEKE